jgi:hypothetical protein
MGDTAEKFIAQTGLQAYVESNHHSGLPQHKKEEEAYESS